jgi:hypothetical protein
VIVVALLAMVVALSLVVWDGKQLLAEAERACWAAGGVRVETRTGSVCVRRDALVVVDEGR